MADLKKSLTRHRTVTLTEKQDHNILYSLKSRAYKIHHIGSQEREGNLHLVLIYNPMTTTLWLTWAAHQPQIIINTK